MKKSGAKSIVREWWEIETMRDKVRPLRKLSGAATAKMGAELSDVSLKLLIASLRRRGKLKEQMEEAGVGG